MKKTLFEDVLILRSVQAGRVLVGRVPFGLSLAFARFMGRIAYTVSKRKHIAYKNLKMAFGSEKSSQELRRIARASFENLAVNAAELLRAPHMDEAYLKKNFTITGFEKYGPYISQKKGMVFLTAHFGGWELLNIASALRGIPLVVLARLQKHPRSDAYLNALRECKGSKVIFKGMMVRELLRSLHAGKVVAFLSDQDGGKGGTFVRMFDRLSSASTGAATIALRTRSPIFPAFLFREKDQHYRIEIEGPLETPPPDASPEEAERTIMQRYTEILESKIRRAPDQWLWGHRRWKSSPDKKVLVLSDGRAGHLHQSMAVVQAMRQARSHHPSGDRIFHEILEVRFRNDFLRKCLSAASFLCRGHLPGRTLWLQAALTPDCFKQMRRLYADTVISCGRSLQDINIWIKKENMAKSILVMKPAISKKLFDVIIVPKHDDEPAGEQVFVTEGALSAILEEDLTRESRKLEGEIALAGFTCKIGLLVGGDTARIRFQPALFEKWMQALKQVCSQRKGALLATSSRRTPVWAEQVMKQFFEDKKVCPFLLIANEDNREGAVSGILGLSDVVVVTGESMSMLSEAVRTGKPVIVIDPWAGGQMKSKYESYLRGLQESKRIVRSTVESFVRDLDGALHSSGRPDAEFRKGQEAVLRSAVERVL